MTDHNELVRQARGYEPDANGFVETSTEFLGRLAARHAGAMGG